MIVHTFRGALLAMLCGWAAFAHAHHNTAKFDFRSYGVIEGEIRLADFRNPHSLIILKVTADNGEVVEHEIDGHSLNIIRRSGLQAGMVQPGDKVTLYFAPSRTDDDMFMRALRLSDGTVLNPGVTAVPETAFETSQD